MRLRSGLLVLATCAALTTLASAEVLSIGGGRIQVDIAGETALPRAHVIQWITRAASAVAGYYGRFPIPELAVNVRVEGRAGAHRGVTNGWRQPHISICIGRETARSDLDGDWVLTHEMCHTAFPNVDRDHHAWAEEGLSTYLEPLARFRDGHYAREQFWRDLIEGLPQGEPASGDSGLDETPTWGRTYWGGALFWFRADLELRRRTQLKLGLEDALRGIVAAGGDIRSDWPLDRALAAGDRATGQTVLVDLHTTLAHTPGPIDLDHVWQALGIHVSGHTVTFDDAAPEAALRRAIEGTPRIPKP